MFEKNDKALFTAHTLLLVVCLIFGIGGALAGLILACIGLIAIGLPLLFCMPFLAWLMWVFGKLPLDTMCDIKLIRNKLYEEDIESFKPFLKEKKETDDEEEQDEQDEQDEQPKAKAVVPQATPSAANTADVIQQLLQLKKLLDDGVITQEEFDVEKAKILKNI